MFNKIKKLKIFYIICMFTFFIVPIFAESSPKIENRSKRPLENVNLDYFNVLFFEEHEFDTNICQIEQKRGINFALKNGDCSFHLFFKTPSRKVDTVRGKNLLALPHESISSAMIINSVDGLKIIDKFISSNLYEANNYRNYILFSEDFHYRIDIWTDKDGVAKELGIVYFENEEGMTNYINAIHVLKKNNNLS